MHYPFKLTLALFTLSLITPAFAATNTEDSYFNALEKINRPEPNARAISPCSQAEKKELIILLKNSPDKDLNTYSFNNGHLSNLYDDTIEVYKGEFDNSGETQYALISTSGTMHANNITILQKQNGRIINRNFNNIIINSLIPNQDMSEFYMHVANPFAVIKDGKTYIRFMNIPYKEYDIGQLQLCTYLWQNDTLTLTGPNWTFNKKSKKMLPFKDCISQ